MVMIGVFVAVGLAMHGFVMGIWLDLVGFVLICVLGYEDIVVVAVVVGWCPLLWFLVGSHYLRFYFV